MRSLTKTLLGGAAAAMIVGTVLAPSAHATCWWAGGNWDCLNAPPPGAVIAPPGGSAAGFYIPAPSWGFDPRSYNYPGPRPSGH
ncbi:MAG TPA: hypothetical protein VHW66_20550 [Stellaceae bacterium]|jgi:hypothetical protein|nr:hypothetical protein [Stellaceae bacterium]